MLIFFNHINSLLPPVIQYLIWTNNHLSLITHKFINIRIDNLSWFTSRYTPPTHTHMEFTTSFLVIWYFHSKNICYKHIYYYHTRISMVIIRLISYYGATNYRQFNLNIFRYSANLFITIRTRVIHHYHHSNQFTCSHKLTSTHTHT